QHLSARALTHPPLALNLDQFARLLTPPHLVRHRVVGRVKHVTPQRVSQNLTTIRDRFALHRPFDPIGHRFARSLIDLFQRVNDRPALARRGRRQVRLPAEFLFQFRVSPFHLGHVVVLTLSLALRRPLLYAFPQFHPPHSAS